ncbi:MAG TPA: tetratricopeptide repeat protein, partial [Acidimicrobiales bacterium]|nr:tetratricopeptide repeat protein [Acidimicrobiales bacterium]
GGITTRQGEPRAALSLLDEGLTCARRCEDEALLASILGAYANAEVHLEDYAAAIAHFEEVVDIYRRANNRASTAADLGNLGYLELLVGRPADARAHLTDAVTVSRELNDSFNLAYGAFNLALVEYFDGRTEEAGRLFTEAVTVAQRRGIKPVAIEGLMALAATVHADDPVRASRLYGACEAARERSGEPVAALEASLQSAAAEHLRQTLGDEEFELRVLQGRGLSLDDGVDLALSVPEEADPPAAPS